MSMLDDKNTAFINPSAQACAPIRRRPSMITAGSQHAGTKAMVADPHAAAKARLQVAKENCDLALDNIEMAKMVVIFLQHLLDVKVRKNMAEDDLASTRATIASARADLESAQLGFRQACKAFHVAYHSDFLGESKVSGQPGATQMESAQMA